MSITSELHWDLYKEQVEKSDDKSIELFATKVEPPRSEIDLNMLVSSPMTDRTSMRSVEAIIMIDASNAYSQLESEDVDVDGDFDEVEEGFHGIDIGDLDAYIAQKEMDHELPFRCLYGYDSDDEVDGGMRKTLIEPIPSPDPGEPRDENEDENAYLKKGLKFSSLPAMKVWLSDYAVPKAAKISVCDGKTVRMQEFHVEDTRLTWAPRFHPFLDQSQWPQYHGTHIKPDPALKVETKGRRRTKRFRGDMDDLDGYTSMNQFGSGHLMEAPNNINCGVCDEGRHNTRTCKERRTSKGGGGGGGGGTGSTSATCGGDGGGGRTRSTSARGGGGGGGGGTGSTSARGAGGRTGSTSGRGGGVGGRRGGTSVRGGGGRRRGSTSARGGGGSRRGSSSARGGVPRRWYVDNGSSFGYLVNPNG
ncbi:hypothetical protein D1007_18197 [Hordeum vulgare]|nr:hypothetical protein D1007_18197 [Hordeum vulgare]